MEDHICMEKAEPRRRFIRSDGVLYVLLLAAVVVIIMAGYRLSAAWNLPRALVQLTLYALLVGLGYLVYRKCLLTFRYTLTDRMLRVDQLVGKKEKPCEAVHLSDIVSVKADGAGEETGKLRSLYQGSRKEALAVTVQERTRRITLLISPSEGFRKKFIEQWKTARK